MSTVTTTVPAATLAQQPEYTIANLRYSVPLPSGETSWVAVNSNNTDGTPESNFQETDHRTKIHNIRTTKTPIGLDVTGFDVRSVPSKFSEDHKNFDDEELIKSQYYEEVTEAMKLATGGKEVFIFDHTLRHRRPGVADNDPSRRQPVPRVHIDQTPRAAIARVKRHMGDRADELLKKRFQLINFWRPIEHPAEDYPLAVCSYKSIDPARDLVPTTLIYPDPMPNGETYNVTHHPDQEFYYLKAQRTDEATFIKCYDSLETVARLTPHTAFEDPNTDPSAPPRRSIEVRCLVFHD